MIHYTGAYATYGDYVVIAQGVEAVVSHVTVHADSSLTLRPIARITKAAWRTDDAFLSACTYAQTMAAAPAN